MATCQFPPCTQRPAQPWCKRPSGPTRAASTKTAHGGTRSSLGTAPAPSTGQGGRANARPRAVVAGGGEELPVAGAATTATTCGHSRAPPGPGGQLTGQRDRLCRIWDRAGKRHPMEVRGQREGRAHLGLWRALAARPTSTGGLGLCLPLGQVPYRSQADPCGSHSFVVGSAPCACRCTC